MKKFPEYKSLELSRVASEVMTEWEDQHIFEKSVDDGKDKKPFVFYEGPPSANGLPGIHHVMSRAIKDIFCRFKTLKGFKVVRKAGWDTHGLPIELSVEKELGITKEDIGKTISIEEYNAKCRENVMKYTGIWNDLTRKMGYWVDMEHPYVTYENKYIESVWHLLRKLYDQDMLYKGYTIQPYSPKAGTGLSTHELNQPGTYQMVKDTTIVAQFKVKPEGSDKLRSLTNSDVYFLAWTTTPWTLPSNAALAVGNNISYALIRTFNPYTFKPVSVVLAEDVVSNFFDKETMTQELPDKVEDSKNLPWKKQAVLKGEELTGLSYEQLLPYVQPLENAEMAFKIIPGDFVSTDEGTGIVHIAPTFGADDMRVAKSAGVPPILVADEGGNQLPLVDLQGRFVKEVTDFAGEYVKEEYLTKEEKPSDYKSVDVRIAIRLKEDNKAFKVAKYEHSYPHCWRTDKPILYYPLDSWFVRTTAARDRMIELNNTINWKPASTGTGRFGNWLENLQDWNLSRSRYWGIPIPIWSTEDRTERRCIGSIEELSKACQESVEKGFMESNPLNQFKPGDMSERNYSLFDLHRPHVDKIILVSENGKPMKREADLIDVWFDSGSMPYAQWHYPFENKEIFEKAYPADFIAEGVDQTRGWFFTLHAIGTMCFDSVAYKNVVSNGLVLDKNGQKMSKRLGNAVDPFATIEKYGPDATRWYLISNAQPWENLKFDENGITEVQRKFFSTLYNTYGFFALYANVDGYHPSSNPIDFSKGRELDRWIISKLNTLVRLVDSCYSDYEPTKASRAIQEFVSEDLSNWYVRLSRRVFWKGENSEEKNIAYQALHQCLETVAILSAPIAPFFMDRLFNDLKTDQSEQPLSVHLASFPRVNETAIDGELEARMDLAQRVTSLVFALRKKERIKVRQPLQKMMIPVLKPETRERLNKVRDLILSEVNIKEMELLDEQNNVLVKKAKPNFKRIGPRYGKLMKHISTYVDQMTQEDIVNFERSGGVRFEVAGEAVSLDKEDLEVISQDIPGWLVAGDDKVTVAVDITLNDALVHEGIAREFVNRIQNLRKDVGLEVTDRIALRIRRHDGINEAIRNNINYICAETLADHLDLVDEIDGQDGKVDVEINDDVKTSIQLDKV